MSFTSEAANFEREPFYFIQVQIGATVFRYCTARGLIPAGLDAIPCLSGQPQTSPAEVDPSGGPGIRASVSCTLNDFADGAASYWAKWRAQNPFYEGARLSYFGGFVVADTYDPANFRRRDYVLEKFQIRRGKVVLTGKDPLKLASNARAQYPQASRGSLLAALPVGTTTATLQPSGIGAQYPASGVVRIRSEVMAFTRSGDSLTLTRAQYNTTQAQHSAGDTVQLCAVLNDSAPNLVSTLLQAAGVASSYIPITAWQAEASIYLPGNYSTILTEPVGVTTLLKELGEQAPHLLYWDDRANVIQFVAVKEPPDSAQPLTWQDHIVADSFDVQDDPDARVTRVFVYFGQVDPTKKLDEPSNYQQTFIRVDPTAETNYGGSKIKTVYSRWISSVNKAAAIRLSARIGRRFYNTPRRVSFALDLKDSDVWTGSPVKLTHPLIVDTGGNPVATDFQVLSASERPGVANYSALEFLYGPSVPEDADADTTGKVVVLSGEMYNINLRAIFNSIYPSFDAADDVRFVFDASAVIGSTSNTTPAIVTGAWEGLTTPPLLDVRGLIVGRGGDGADGAAGEATAGGTAIRLDGPIRLNNSGVIGGGGGGGGSANDGVAYAAGGGGAGFASGAGGSQGSPSGTTSFTAPQNGGRTTGGSGGRVIVVDNIGEIHNVSAGRGGDLGQSGETRTTAGGAAGVAIKTNGYSITNIGAGTGDVRGAITA